MSCREQNFTRILLLRMGAMVCEKTDHPRHCSPPFALKYIQALLNKTGRYVVKLIDGMVEPLPLERLSTVILSSITEVLVIQTNALTVKLAFGYASLVKKNHNKIFIVMICQDVIPHFEEYLSPNSPFDVVILGDSEKESVSLIEELRRHKDIKEVKEYYRLRAGIPNLNIDLDSLPFPDYNKEEIEKYRFVYPLNMNKKVRWGHILSSRGCPYRCIFCSGITRESYGEKVRLRSAANVVDEMEQLKRKGVNVISFDDDNFTTSKEHVEKICLEIKRRNLNISWICHARINEVTLSLLKRMKEAGCRLLRFGIESGSVRIIEALNKSEDGEDWIQRTKDVFKKARGVGILTDALFIIGSPTETRENIVRSIKLARELNPDLIQVHFFTPYFGTEVYRRFKDRIEDKNLSKMYHYDLPLVNLSSVGLEELWNLRAYFYKSFLLNPKFLINHIIKHILFYLCNRWVFIKLFNARKLLRRIKKGG